MWSATARRRMLPFQRSREVSLILFYFYTFISSYSFLSSIGQSWTISSTQVMRNQSVKPYVYHCCLVWEHTWFFLSLIILYFPSLTLVSLKFVNHFGWVWRPFKSTWLHANCSKLNKSLIFCRSPNNPGSNRRSEFACSKRIVEFNK